MYIDPNKKYRCIECKKELEVVKDFIDNYIVPRCGNCLPILQKKYEIEQRKLGHDVQFYEYFEEIKPEYKQLEE